MSDSLPQVCQVALKEWASVIQAVARGEQLVLIRKGGLIEPGSGFAWRSRVFVFYPTYEHQTVGFIRPPHQPLFQEAMAGKPADGHLTFAWAGVVAQSASSRDPQLLKRLEPFHIYNDAFLAQWLKWQPDQPLVVAAVRAYRLASPKPLPAASHYAGCKSWVDLDQPVSLSGATPALDDQTFADRLSRMQALLGLH